MMVTLISGKKSIAAAVAFTAAVSLGTPQYSWSATPQVRGQWAGTMGESTLRRFYSAGGDMGEVINRVVSYQTANRVWQLQQSRPNPPAASDMRTRTDSWAAQNDSLIPIAAAMERPLYFRVMAPMAVRGGRLSGHALMQDWCSILPGRLAYAMTIWFTRATATSMFRHRLDD